MFHCHFAWDCQAQAQALIATVVMLVLLHRDVQTMVKPLKLWSSIPRYNNWECMTCAFREVILYTHTMLIDVISLSHARHTHPALISTLVHMCIGLGKHDHYVKLTHPPPLHVFQMRWQSSRLLLKRKEDPLACSWGNANSLVTRSGRAAVLFHEKLVVCIFNNTHCISLFCLINSVLKVTSAEPKCL